MLNQLQMKEHIIALLKTLPVCGQSSNGKNFVVRCPYCGDSTKQNHGHFSILIDLTSDAPMIYRCLRCNESGTLTSQVLEDLNLNLSQALQKNLAHVNLLSGGTSDYFRDKIKPFKIPIPKDTAENARKLDYINRRLGTSLDYKKCVEYHIVLSVVEFMRENGIKISKENNGKSVDVKPAVILELERNYLGFLSSNNNKITFRDITPDQKGYFGRYYKLTVDLFNRTPNTFYGLKNQFNILYTGPIDIHIAEGTFDILSVYENLPHEESQNALFFASCGYGFGTILKYLVFMGVDTDVTLHIYSDADKSDSEHRRALRKHSLDIWLDKVIIHRNGYPGEKDFGVPKDHIQEYNYRLKL